MGVYHLSSAQDDAGPTKSQKFVFNMLYHYYIIIIIIIYTTGVLQQY